MVHTLGDERYGIWSLIVSFSGHYGLLAFGINGAMTRYLAYSVAQQDHAGIQGYMNTSLFFLALAGLLCLTVGGGVAVLFPRIFVIPSTSTIEAQTTCFIVAATMATTLVFAAFQSLLVADQRFDIVNIIGIASTLVRAILTVYLLMSGYGLVGLAYIGLIITVLTGGVQFIIVRKLHPELKISLRPAGKSYRKELLDYGSKSFTMNIAVSLVYECDLFVLGLYLSPDKITTYSLASTLIMYFLQFINAIAYTFGPYATELYARNTGKELRQFLIDGSCIMYMIGGLATAGCFVLSKAFFTLWVGISYVESAKILMLLIIPQFFATGARVGVAIVLGMAKVKIPAAIAIFEGVSNIILSLILVRYYGVVGVAIGTVLPMLLTNAIIFPAYAAYSTNVKLYEFYLKSVLPGILIIMAGVGVGQIISIVFPPVSWFSFVTNTLLISIVCLSLSYPILSRRTGNSLLRFSEL